MRYSYHACLHPAANWGASPPPTRSTADDHRVAKARLSFLNDPLRSVDLPTRIQAFMLGCLSGSRSQNTSRTANGEQVVCLPLCHVVCILTLCLSLSMYRNPPLL